MKTSELIGPALDWAVAKCEDAMMPAGNVVAIGRQLFIAVGGDCAHGGSTVEYSPSTDWSQGGPIIEREIDYYEKDAALFQAVIYGPNHTFSLFDKIGFCGVGPTPLIAAMRCYVASKLGDEVDIPEELQ